MEIGDAHVADPLDTVLHEIDSVVCGHHVLPVIGENSSCRRSLPIHNDSDKGFSDSGPHSKKLFIDHMAWPDRDKDASTIFNVAFQVTHTLALALIAM